MMEASRVGVDAFGAFLEALREYEHEGEGQVIEDLSALTGGERPSDLVRHILLSLRDTPEPLSAEELLARSGLPVREFSMVMRTLLGVGFVTLTVRAGGAAVELTDEGRAAAAAL
jgi:hypothetical protein